MEYRKIKDDDDEVQEDNDVASDLESLKGKSHTGESLISQSPLLLMLIDASIWQLRRVTLLWLL